MMYATTPPILAMEQWSELVAAIENAGGTVEVIDGHPDLPDMVFTANLGVVNDGVFVPGAMRHEERKREPEEAAIWASERGMPVERISPRFGSFEGMGDALPFAGRFIAGFGQRSSESAWTALTTTI